MASIHVFIALCLAATAVATPASLRAVANPRTARQITNRLVEDTIEIMTEKNWIPTKNVQNGNNSHSIPVSDASGSVYDFVDEYFRLTSASLTGLESMKGSRWSEMNSDETEMVASFKFQDIRVTGSEQMVWPGKDEAKANNQNGVVTERLVTYFCNATIPLKALTPQSIKIYTCGGGSNELESVTNLSNNDYRDVYVEQMRNALYTVATDVIKKNVKVSLNQAIQAWKAETA